MAVTKQGFIFGTFLLSCVSLVHLGIGIATQHWVYGINNANDRRLLNYGLFTGNYDPNTGIGSNVMSLYQTCLLDLNICAFSCRPTSDLRRQELQMLYDGQNLLPACTSTIEPAGKDGYNSNINWYNAGVHVSTLVFFGIAIFFTILSALLGIYNTKKTPIEPIWGILGLKIWNGCSSAFTIIGMMIWGIHYDINLEVTFATVPIMLDEDRATLNRGIGWSYWILIPCIFYPMVSIGLLFLRDHLIRTQPPPARMSIEKTDDTIFLY